jgi:hypothetical protein
MNPFLFFGQAKKSIAAVGSRTDFHNSVAIATQNLFQDSNRPKLIRIKKKIIHHEEHEGNQEKAKNQRINT